MAKWPTWSNSRLRPHPSVFLPHGLYSRKVMHGSLACCPTWISSGTKFNIEHNLLVLSDIEKERLSVHWPTKSLFPSLVLFFHSCHLKKMLLQGKKWHQCTTSFDASCFFMYTFGHYSVEFRQKYYVKR